MSEHEQMLVELRAMRALLTRLVFEMGCTVWRPDDPRRAKLSEEYDSVARAAPVVSIERQALAPLDSVNEWLQSNGCKVKA